MPKAYVVNSSGHDFKGGLDGEMEMVVLSEGKVNVFNLDRVRCEFEKLMEGYGENDCLINSGAIQLNLIAFQIAMELYGYVNILIFNHNTKKYVKRTVKNKNDN